MTSLAAILVAPASSRAADGACAAAPPSLPAGMTAQLATPRAYPSFCSIPPVPKDVRDASAFKNAVVDTRLAGVRLVRDTSPAAWSVDETDAFALTARGQAEPPPAITSPDETEAFVQAMRAKAAPPSRPH